MFQKQPVVRFLFLMVCLLCPMMLLAEPLEPVSRQVFNTNSIVVTILLLVSLLLNWLAWHNNPMFLRNKFQIVMHSKERGSFHSATMRSQITSYVLFVLVALLNVGIFLFHALHFYLGEHSEIMVLICFAGVVAYHGLKYGIFHVAIKSVFLPKGYLATLAQSYLFLNIILGMLFFLLNLVFNFINNELILHLAFYGSVVFYGIYLVILTSRMVYIFYKDIASLFYLILYLCTLEILPLWVVFKLSVNLLILNE